MAQIIAEMISGVFQVIAALIRHSDIEVKTPPKKVELLESKERPRWLIESLESRLDNSIGKYYIQGNQEHDEKEFPEDEELYNKENIEEVIIAAIRCVLSLSSILGVL